MASPKPKHKLERSSRASSGAGRTPPPKDATKKGSIRGLAESGGFAGLRGSARNAAAKKAAITRKARRGR